MTTRQIAKYPFDPTGVSLNNRVANERHEITPTDTIIVPRAGLFYANNLSVVRDGRILRVGRDYVLVDMEDEYTERLGQAVFTSIRMIDPTQIQEVAISYQAVGVDGYTRQHLQRLIESLPEQTKIPFHNITDLPTGFNPAPHTHPPEEIEHWTSMARLFQDTNQLLSHFKWAHHTKIYAYIQEVQEGLLRKMQQVLDDIGALRNTSHDISSLSNQVDVELERIRTQVASLGSFDAFQQLLTNELGKIKGLLDAAKIELRNHSDTADTRQTQAIQQELTQSIQALQTTLNEEKATIARTYVKKSDMAAHLRPYATASALASLSTRVDGLASQDWTTNQITEAISNIQYENLVGIPRLFKHVPDTTRDEGYASTSTSMKVAFRGDVNSRGTTPFWNIEWSAETAQPQFIFRRMRAIGSPEVTESATPFVHFGTTPPRDWALRPCTISRSLARNEIVSRPVADANGLQNTEMTILSLPGNVYKHQLILMDVENVIYQLQTPVGYKKVNLVTTANLEKAMRGLDLGPTAQEIAEQIRAYVGDLSSFTVVQNLIHRVESTVQNSKVQSNETDYHEGKLPKLFKGGMLSVQRIRLNNGAHIDYNRSEVMFDQAIATPNVRLTSDRTKKSEMTVIDQALSKLSQLKGYTYRLNETQEVSGGLIAQDVQSVLPEAVKGKEGEMTLEYHAVIGLLVNAVNELEKRVKQLEGK